MSACPHCRVFSGVPTCSVCKTYFRVGSLLQGGKLSPYQEGQALGALRNCAGALTDLVEVGGSGPFGSHALGDGATGVKEAGRSPEKEVEAKEETEEKKAAQEEEEEAKVEPKKDKGPKKEKKKGKKKDEVPKKKSPSPKERSPSPATGDRGRSRASALPAVGSRERHPESEERGSRRERDREEEELRREDKRRRTESRPPSDREVRSDPSRYGLEQIPIRGSAGRHYHSGTIPAGHRPPPEPVGSLPRHRDGGGHHGGSRFYPGRRHPGGKPFKWKGYAHYTRGVEYWKNKKRR